jgi:polysaccharide export outer membrane protein
VKSGTTSRHLPCTLALAAGLLALACSHSPTVPDDPVAGAKPLPVNPERYLIGSGDTLQVFVWRNPELSTTVPVRPDGNISTPLVDDMVAIGKTPIQLAHDMESILGKYVRNPKVNIIVMQPVSSLSQVTVVGQVGHPLSLPYHEGMTVLEALLASGGLGQYAAGNRAKIVRNGRSGHVELPVKLSRLTEKGDLSQNLPLRPGDVLVVPRALF